MLGSNAQNVADRHARGRDARGERNGFARLTDADALAIHEALTRGGATQASLARRYSVAPQTISTIATGRRWVPRAGMAISVGVMSAVRQTSAI